MVLLCRQVLMVVRAFGGLGSPEAVGHWLRITSGSLVVFYAVYAGCGFLGYVAFSSARVIHGDIFLNFESDSERRNTIANAAPGAVTTYSPYTALFAFSFWSALFRVVFVCVNLMSCVVVVEPCRQSLASLLGISVRFAILCVSTSTVLTKEGSNERD